MWRCTKEHLRPLLGDGEKFPHLVDRLIRATASKHGVKQSDLQTQLRTNIKDGGVDLQIDVAFPGCGLRWFDDKSCWQFKATDAVDEDDKIKKTAKNELQKEVNKPYAKKLMPRKLLSRLASRIHGAISSIRCERQLKPI